MVLLETVLDLFGDVFYFLFRGLLIEVVFIGLV